MSQELHAFFVKVTDDEALQNQLNLTNEIVDVTIIAKGLGFKITGAEILCAQANRVLSLLPHELEYLAAERKVKWRLIGDVTERDIWIMQVFGCLNL